MYCTMSYDIATILKSGFLHKVLELNLWDSCSESSSIDKEGIWW